MRLQALLSRLLEINGTTTMRTLLVDLSGWSPEDIKKLQKDIENFGTLFNLPVRTSFSEKELEVVYDARIESKLMTKLGKLGLEYVTVEKKMCQETEELRGIPYAIPYVKSAIRNLESAKEALQKNNEDDGIQSIGDALKYIGVALTKLGGEIWGIAVRKIGIGILDFYRKLGSSKPDKPHIEERDKKIDYEKIAGAFDHLRNIGMSGIRSAKEGNFIKIGSGVSASLDTIGEILVDIGEDHLGDQAIRLADLVRSELRPEIRPDESRFK